MLVVLLLTLLALIDFKRGQIEESLGGYFSILVLIILCLNSQVDISGLLLLDLVSCFRWQGLACRPVLDDVDYSNIVRGCVLDHITTDS